MFKEFANSDTLLSSFLIKMYNVSKEVDQNVWWPECFIVYLNRTPAIGAECEVSETVLC